MGLLCFLLTLALLTTYLALKRVYPPAVAPVQRFIRARAPWLSSGSAAPQPQISPEAAAAQRALAQESARQGAQFAREAAQFTPRLFVTQALVAANILVYIAMAIAGVSLFQPRVIDLLVWGANIGPLTCGGDWWRLITNIFVHIGLFHLVLNMIVLWIYGRVPERIFGNWQFLLIYLCTGWIGSMLSTICHPTTTSAGASGAIFGLFGALLGFALRRDPSVPQAVRNSLGRLGVVFIGYNVIYGLQVQHLDWAAHAGGCLSGILFGFVGGHSFKVKDRATIEWKHFAATCGCFCALALVMMPFMPHVSPETYTALKNVVRSGKLPAAPSQN